MSMRDMLTHMRYGPSVVTENLSLLDTHAKLHGTPDALPDREMTWHKHDDTKNWEGLPETIEGWGHPVHPSDVPTGIIKHMPNAHTAIKLYDPPAYLLHGSNGIQSVKADEPEFHHVEHELVHTVSRYDAHAPAGQHHKHLHSDVLHKQTFIRAPEEAAQQFSNRVHRGAEYVSITQHNDMHEGEDVEHHEVPLVASFDPLEQWHNEEKEKNFPVHIGYSGSLSHHTNPADTAYRHNQITQDFSHYIKVR